MQQQTLAPSQRELLAMLQRVELTTRIAFDISVSVLVVTGYGWTSLARPTKDRKIADARTIFCHECAKAGLSNSEIGNLIGRDHSSITHNTKRYRELYQFNRPFRQMANDVSELIDVEPIKSYNRENA